MPLSLLISPTQPVEIALSIQHLLMLVCGAPMERNLARGKWLLSKERSHTCRPALPIFVRGGLSQNG